VENPRNLPTGTYTPDTSEIGEQLNLHNVKTDYLFMGAVVTIMKQIIIKRENRDGRNSRLLCAEVQRYLPQDLLRLVTVLFQGSGYVTISPIALTRYDWRRINVAVKGMGGIWVSNQKYSHWSIPFS
jgi:hypothetical protein